MKKATFTLLLSPVRSVDTWKSTIQKFCRRKNYQLIDFYVHVDDVNLCARITLESNDPYQNLDVMVTHIKHLVHRTHGIELVRNKNININQ